MTARFYHGCDILAPAGRLAAHGVLVEGGQIRAILPADASSGAPRIALPPEALLAPGYIDVQVNGGGGILFNDAPSPEAARAMAAAHLRLGTLSILPTLITSPPASMQAAAACADAGEGILGIHFEGPFLSPRRPGVHRPELIRAPEEADLVLLTSLARQGRGRVLLTIAPECVPAASQARLAAAGVILSAGHSEAAFEDVGPALRGVTHLFNAMPPLAARAPGLAAAALLGDLFTAVIVDGIHVHPAMLRLLLKARDASRIMLVSDAMSPTGTQATSFELQGRTVLRRHGRLEMEDGVLAGADLCLAQAVRNAVALLGVPAEQAIAMASAVPADFLGLSHQRGRIAPGLRADLLLLSPALEVMGVCQGGAWQNFAGLFTP